MIKKKIICFIFNEFYPSFSGHSLYMIQIMEKLINDGNQIYVITKTSDNISNIIFYKNIIIIPLKKCNNELLFSIKIIFQIIKIHRDIVAIHINGFIDRYFFIQIISKILGIKLIIQSTLWGSDDAKSFMKNRKFAKIRLFFLKKVDMIIGISKKIVDSYIQLGFEQGKVKYIKQGVDIKKFHPVNKNEKEELRKKLNFKIENKICIFIGTVMYRKGVDILIDSWIQIQNKSPETLLLIVGMKYFDSSHKNHIELNKYVSKIEKKIQEHNLNVIFTGLKNNVDELLQISDIFIFPSRREGFGNVIIEAMSTGLPCIITPMEGISEETVINNNTGFIIDSTKEMADKVIFLLNDHQIREQFGREARKVCLDKFDLNFIYSKYLELYR